MRYTLLMHYVEPEAGALSEEDMRAGMEAMGAYTATLQRAGVLLGAEVLQPDHASSSGLRAGRCAQLRGRRAGSSATPSPGDAATLTCCRL